MKEVSRRAKRMERHHKRKKQPGLNLVSLMDIFTILVFFLLVSSSNVQQLHTSKEITLPTSISSAIPKETLVITITARDILVQGRKVAATSDVIASAEPMIAALVDELNFEASKSRFSSTEKKARNVTIIGDRKIPYEVLSKILSSCREANYTKISFAAVQKSRSKS
ncbi:MAG: biopolymer transporter ExbD [Thiotrichaceae bacterium]|nr:biopolymer transporter ExbD [Thiotrichaceae bacterium]